MVCRVNRLCGVVFAGVAAVMGGACASGNQSPILVDQQASTDEDVAVDLAVLDGARDPDGDPITVTSAAAPGHGVEVVDGAIVRLTPAPDFHGSLHVAYTISDGRNPDVIGRVIVTVRRVNDAPVAIGGRRELHGRQPITLEARDPDGDRLAYEIVAGPDHGTITGTGPVLQYTPSVGFTGDDEIRYRVSDGALTSQPAALELRVTPGAPPIAVSEAGSTSEDQPLEVVLQVSDPDGDALAFTIVAPPAHGALAGAAPRFVYTPERDFNGDDELRFSVSDGLLASETATFTIHVRPVNDVPVATPQAVAAIEDTSIAVTLGGADVDGDGLTFAVGSLPAHGTLSTVVGATVSYTPALNYHGPDSFTFVTLDGRLRSSPATVTLQVASVDDPPVAMALTRTLAEDTTAPIGLVGSDADSGSLTFTIVTPPAHGSLTGTPPALTYVPVANYAGPDSFTYTVADAASTSAPATVTLQVTPVNDRPVALDSAVTTAEDTPITVALPATDIDDATLSFTIMTPPSDGVVSRSGANLTYTPALNATGTRVVTFVASDSSLTSSPGTIRIEITPVNDAPIALDDFVATDPGVELTVDAVANDTDADAEALTLASVDPPAHGSAAIVAGKLVYTPEVGRTGIEILSYTVVDPHLAASTGHIQLGVGTFPPGAPRDRLTTAIVDTGDRDNAPSISGDGRYVAFIASPDVYLYDRGTRTMARASAASDGTPGNGFSAHPHVSGNGRYVLFDSVASNLVPGDSNGVMDVFRHDRVTGETLRISVATGGAQASAPSSMATISDDGNLIAFTSSAFDLVPDDANGASDVFVRDVAAGTTTRVSLSTTGGDGDLGSLEAVISGDGRRVAFSSVATNLTVGDGNNQRDVFVRDLVAGTTIRASVSSVGGESNGLNQAPWLSRDGRYVSFLSRATNLVVPATGSSQLYVRDTQAPTTTRPSPAAISLVIWGRLSGDGRHLVEDTSAGIVAIDRFAATTINLSSGGLNWPVISGDGRYVVVYEVSGRGVVVLPNPLAPP